MTEVIIIYPDGTDACKRQNGQTVVTDSFVDTMTFSIQSSSGVGLETIKDLIQERFKVVFCSHSQRKIFVT